MCCVLRNFGITSLMKVLPNAMSSKSKYQQSILKYLIFYLFLFSLAELYVTYHGFLVLDLIYLKSELFPAFADSIKR
jgi:hypothetical protein